MPAGEVTKVRSSLPQNSGVFNKMWGIATLRFRPPLIPYLGHILAHNHIHQLLLHDIVTYPPPPPLQSPVLAHDGLPGGVGGWSPSDGLPGGGGGGCKGIPRQAVVPSIDASKENTREATFALMPCQCASSNTNVIGDPKER